MYFNVDWYDNFKLKQGIESINSVHRNTKNILYTHKLYIYLNWFEGNQDVFSNAKICLKLIFTFLYDPS